MKHKLKFITDYNGYVCVCSRYFDDKEQFEKHLKENETKITKGHKGNSQAIKES